MIDKSEYAEWLASGMDHNAGYHNHKETMAWVVTALYVPGIIYLGYLEGQVLRVLGVEILVILFMFLVAFPVLIFVTMQFDMRWHAADAVQAFIERWADLNGGGELPRADEWKIKEGEKWPYVVQRRIDELKARRSVMKGLESFGNLALLDWKEVDDRWKTELPLYCLIIIATLLAMFLAWN
ncbi:MAG: hypothetical protein ACE5LA_03715 [Dehalococcoidales bacterium]